MTVAGHGVNVGHGFVKYIVIDEQGQQLEPVVFPALISRASKGVAGSITRVDMVDAGGVQWWVGDDAFLSPNPITILAQERLTDPVFIPALLRSALQRFGTRLNGAAHGYCITGLPATWAEDVDKARALGQRLRDVTTYTNIRAIPEPLGIIYAELLDTNGEVVGDDTLQSGQVGIVDMGHHTVDTCIVRKMTPVKTSLDTYQLGTARPLQQVRALLSARFEREFSLVEVDQAVREKQVKIAGQMQPLPMGWDRAFIENGEAIAARLVEAWGIGAHLDVILLGGGGAEVEVVVNAIQKRYAHAEVVENPQLAIAEGYAKLARKFALRLS